jgi:predicted nucleotidyltransferase
MVTNFIFLQDFSGFFKNGQKKMSKIENPKILLEKKIDVLYNKFPKQLKELQYNNPKTT